MLTKTLKITTAIATLASGAYVVAAPLNTMGIPAGAVGVIHADIFTYNRVDNSDLISSVVGPVHTVTNTYEANRDIITSKQNRVTIGLNTNAIVSQYDYTVNSIGQRTTRTQSGTAFDGIGYASGTQLPLTMTGAPSSGTTTDTFSYNSRGEVVASTNNQLFAQNRSYTYDPIGNRLATTEGELSNPDTAPNAKTYTSNPLNQYTEINTTVPTPPTTTQSTYDDDGNILTDGTGKVYTWDCENRLTQVTLPNNEIVRYYYDATSRRIQRQHITSNNTQTTTYLYADWNVIQETIFGSLPSSESVTLVTSKTYHWGLDLSNSLQGSGGVGGLLHGKTTSNEVLSDQCYTYDANGNVSELLGSIGVTTGHYEYDLFGKETIIINASSTGNVYRFSTKPWDAACDLNYYGCRFYAPSLGRWLSRDRIWESAFKDLYQSILSETMKESEYNFIFNNSVGNIDYLGMLICFTPKWKSRVFCGWYCCVGIDGSIGHGNRPGWGIGAGVVCDQNPRGFADDFWDWIF